MSDQLYHDALLALAKDKEHSGRLDPCNGSARADNPLCGDRVTIDLLTVDGRIAEIAQKTRGCILTQAAAAMIARHARGQSLVETTALAQQAKLFLEGHEDAALWPEFAHFEPVRDVVSRHDCILIAFHALGDAAKNAQNKEPQQ